MEIPNQSQSMSQNAAQWLAEVQSLQRQLRELQQERDQAYSSADNWRKLYEGEGQQRRRDAAVAAQKIEQLQARLDEYRQSADTAPTKAAPTQSSQGDRTPLNTSPDDANQTQALAALEQQIAALTHQCTMLEEQLAAEKDSHDRTRQSLTAALGDAVDQLARERQPASDLPNNPPQP